MLIVGFISKRGCTGHNALQSRSMILFYTKRPVLREAPVGGESIDYRVSSRYVELERSIVTLSRAVG